MQSLKKIHAWAQMQVPQICTFSRRLLGSSVIIKINWLDIQDISYSFIWSENWPNDENFNMRL